MKTKFSFLAVLFMAVLLFFNACENGSDVNTVPETLSIRPIDTNDIESDEIVFQFMSNRDYGKLSVMNPKFCYNMKESSQTYVIKGYKDREGYCGIKFVSAHKNFTIGQHLLYNRMCDTGMIQACYFKPMLNQLDEVCDFQQYDCKYAGGILNITKIENGKYSGTFWMNVVYGNDTIKITDGIFKNVPLKEGK